MHTDLQVGSKITVSIPRSRFRLVPNENRKILIAGGIGVTPILGMAQALKSRGLSFDFHLYVRTKQHVPFENRLKSFTDELHIYAELNVTETADSIAEALSAHASEEVDVYVCGPGGMISMVQSAAANCGIASERVHFEHFAASPNSAKGPKFAIKLARSGARIQVEEGQSMLAAIRQHVEINASCEQGVCGACFTRVLSGEPDHRDYYLSEKEKASASCIMPCVSRSRSDEIVLDL